MPIIGCFSALVATASAPLVHPVYPVHPVKKCIRSIAGTDHHFAEVGTGLQMAVGGRGVFEGENAVDDGFEPVLNDGAIEGFKHFPAANKYAIDRGQTSEDFPEGDIAGEPADAADHMHLAIGGEGTQ